MKADLNRAYYRSVGQNLMIDALCVEFEVDGEIYTHQLPNVGWGYETPSLAFLGFTERQPTDAEDGVFHFDGETVPVAKNEQSGSYNLQQKVLIAGAKKLEEADWFDPDGEVWNSGGQSAVVAGAGPDPRAGNRAGVPVDGEE